MSDVGEFDQVERLFVGFKRFLREAKAASENKALQLLIVQVEDDLTDAGNRLIALRSRQSRLPEGEVVPYGDDNDRR